MTRRRDTRDGRAQSVGPRAVSITDDQLVEVHELSEVRSLQIAIHERPEHVEAAQHAAVGAGHVVVTSATGSEGLERIASAIRSGMIEAVLVGVPGGEPVIDAALALAPRRPVVIAACDGPALAAVRRSSDAGADLVTVRPHDSERLAPILLAAGRLFDETRNVTNAKGSEAVLRARLGALVEPEPGSLQPFELFQRVLELELKRARRYEYALSVVLLAVDARDADGDASPPPPGIRGILRARAGNAIVHAIRDIDLATELDQERFLVLLPYTDLDGAAEVAKRIIVAVRESDPVVAAGRTFPCRVAGGVAGDVDGQLLSFARLMRDATRALEKAKHDGVELALPMRRTRKSRNA